MIRVVQTHTVWFERPFLLRLGTLLPDYTILGKLDFRSRIPKPDFRSRTLIRRRTHSELGYLPIRLQIHGPIPWTNPFTIRPFSGVPHYYWDVGLLLDSLPKPDFRSRTHLELGYLPIRLQIHGPIPWTNPFTIRSFSGVPHYYWDVGLL